MTAIKERSILFSGPMVRALPNGSKTQTRRVVKRGFNDEGERAYLVPTKHWTPDDIRKEYKCPYGQPGDRLYVKEAWRTLGIYDHLKPSELPADAPIWYEADGKSPKEFPDGRYRHARFMMRHQSRILLEIVSVRVERLQDISEADAKAEGVQQNQDGSWHDYADPDRLWQDDAKASFISLWLKINGPDSWEANPWVWVMTFKRL